jgi:hypothetical protein
MRGSLPGSLRGEGRLGEHPSSPREEPSYGGEWERPGREGDACARQGLRGRSSLPLAILGASSPSARQCSSRSRSDVDQHLEPGGHVCSGFFFSLLGCAVLRVTSLEVGRTWVGAVALEEVGPGTQFAPAGQVASGF